MCRSNQLIRIIRRPVYPSRPVVSVWLPVPIAPLGSPVARPVPRPIAHSARVVSSFHRHVLSFGLSFFYHHPVVIPSWLVLFTAAGASNRRGQRGRWRGGLFFFSCAVFVSSLSFAHIIGFSSSGASDRPVPRRGGLGGGSPIISSGSSHSSPLPPPGLITEAVVPVIFQASNGIMAASLLGSSSHPITAMIGGGGVSPGRLVSCVSAYRLVLYRGH